jgi:hypothetical protein
MASKAMSSIATDEATPIAMPRLISGKDDCDSLGDRCVMMGVPLEEGGVGAIIWLAPGYALSLALRGRLFLNLFSRFDTIPIS